MLELRFAFARHCEVLLWHNYVMYMFHVVTYFDGVRITLYFDTFELRTEIPLQLRFVFVRHRDTCKYRHNYVSFLFVIVTIFLFDVFALFDDFRITLHFGTFELRTEITI